MAVRRLHPDQPAHFAFTAENETWAREQIAKYPTGRQAGAIIPLLWRAQEQVGWLPEPAIRYVTDMLGMAHIRGLEVATFYTMFQLSPVGSKAHVQVCGTTPCMLRGSNELIEVCKRRIAPHQHELNADCTLSWEEVECLGNCANAPMVQVHKDTFEDLTPAHLEAVIDGFLAGEPPLPGSQIGRVASCPEGGPTTLTDASLYDGSSIGAWKQRFTEIEQAAQPTVEVTPPSALASPAHKAAVAAGTAPSSPGGDESTPKAAVHPAALTAMANARLVKELNARGGGKPMSADELERMKASTVLRAPQFGGGAPGDAKPALLAAPRDGKGDDLGLIWGVADKLADKLNAMGIWHFDQIAKWTPANVAWFEAQMDGFKGRIDRDKWIEQCQKLASGWRPGSDTGERPKG
jgi:NADH-quinone oxidoreductase subunit E